MAGIGRRNAEIFLVVEETMLQTFFLFSLVLTRYRNRIRNIRRHRDHRIRYRMVDRIPKQVEHMTDLVSISDSDCFNNLRMNRDTFSRLCYLLRHRGGLVDTRYVSVLEKVALFLSVSAHHKKIRVHKFDFKISGQTVSKHFHVVLNAVLKLHQSLLATAVPVDDECMHHRWKWFKGCLGALDGTYVDVTVSEADKARYRTRKGGVSVNVLAVCDRRMRFIYMLTGWEGSAADSRVLRDDISRPNGLKVPQESLKVRWNNLHPSSFAQHVLGMIRVEEAGVLVKKRFYLLQ